MCVWCVWYDVVCVWYDVVCVCVCVHICTGVRTSLKNPIRKHLRAGEMALQLRGLATKSESLSLIPRTHV